MKLPEMWVTYDPSGCLDTLHRHWLSIGVTINFAWVLEYS